MSIDDARHEFAAPDPTEAQLVSELAQQQAEQRHAEAQREAQRQHPDFVLDIEFSEVMYTVPPRLLPLRYVDFEILARRLKEKWGVVPDLANLKLDPILERRPLEQIAALGKDELIGEVLRSPDANVAFVSGKYPVSDFEFVPILNMRMNVEVVAVRVAGVSRVAEVVAAEAVEAIWAAAGATRPWSEIEPHLQRIGYATGTRINFGTPFETLLSRPTRTFLEDQMIAGPRYAAHMGQYHALPTMCPRPRAVCTYALDDLVLRFTWFDPDTGLTSTTNMKFTVTAKSDYRTGIVSVWSELPYDVHVECLQGLIDALGEEQ